MRPQRDRLARAYAVLGLARGCSIRDAARQYKRLVKRWHPDQYASDPQGQAEAAQRMREINAAFAVLQQASRETRSGRRSEPKSPQPGPLRPPTAHRRLSEAELKAIADAIDTPSLAGVLGRYLAWAFSVGAGLLLVVQPGQRPRNIANLIAGVCLLVGATIHWIYTVRFAKP